LGTSFGRGGATTFQQDLANADVIVIQGSNMAECHPVGFQWVVEAQRRGATVIHVDPRYTRTSALADIHVPIRAGSDIAFLGGIVNYILENERYFEEYVKAYTNAATVLHEQFRDTEDLDGLFSGYDPERGRYDIETWQYDGMTLQAAAGSRETAAARGEAAGAGGAGKLEHGDPPHTDYSLRHPRCVFQLLKKHYRRYTPEMVEEVCGIPQALFLRVCEALCENSGRERTGAFCYAVGWTQHTVGVQYIRTACIIQLLLGNIGRPGGGVMALRGHASIQGSTDIPTLYNLLPGYLPMPHAGHYDDLAHYVELDRSHAGFWANFGSYAVSLLKAWFGDRATAENDFCWDYLPRITGDHSAYQHFLAMLDGRLRGYFLLGENPAVGSANSRLHRFAMAELDWLIVRDLFEIESASFWKDGPEVDSGELTPEEIRTEVFLLPAASHSEKNGSFTNTQRVLQWHDAAVEPQGDCRSDLWFMYHLGLIIREKLAASEEERDRPLLDLTWAYPTQDEHAEPDAEAVLREINGWDTQGNPLSGYTELKDDGATACGTWIYCGCFKDGVNQTRRRKPGSDQHWVAPEWAWAWPDNRRILYNRASADPEGKPWSERKRCVWWDAERREWTGFDTPDFKRDKPPDYEPPDGAEGDAALRGDEPFIMQDDGKGWLYVPTGLEDGPFPTHYEPRETPFGNSLYAQQCNPVRLELKHRHSPFNPTAGEPGVDRFPYVLTTYRLTEHHTAGGMSRTVGRLSELQPEMFCEVGSELAAERGLRHGEWATIITSRTAIEARVMITQRMAPLVVQGRAVQQVGLPYHWGYKGLTTGDSANDLFHLALDPNVQIQEVKAATCDIRPGRRPRGPALRAFVEQHSVGDS